MDSFTHTFSLSDIHKRVRAYSRPPTLSLSHMLAHWKKQEEQEIEGQT